MAEKLYRLYCEICEWKIITDGNDDIARSLVEIKTSSIPTGIPKLDEETKKIVTPAAKRQIKKFKCPNCGRGIRPKKIDNVQEKAESNREIRKRIEERNNEDWSDGRKESVERFKI